MNVSENQNKMRLNSGNSKTQNNNRFVNNLHDWLKRREPNKILSEKQPKIIRHLRY